MGHEPSTFRPHKPDSIYRAGVVWSLIAAQLSSPLSSVVASPPQTPRRMEVSSFFQEAALVPPVIEAFRRAGDHLAARQVVYAGVFAMDAGGSPFQRRLVPVSLPEGNNVLPLEHSAPPLSLDDTVIVFPETDENLKVLIEFFTRTPEAQGIRVLYNGVVKRVLDRDSFDLLQPATNDAVIDRIQRQLLSLARQIILLRIFEKEYGHPAGFVGMGQGQGAAFVASGVMTPEQAGEWVVRKALLNPLMVESETPTAAAELGWQEYRSYLMRLQNELKEPQSILYSQWNGQRLTQLPDCLRELHPSAQDTLSGESVMQLIAQTDARVAFFQLGSIRSSVLEPKKMENPNPKLDIRLAGTADEIHRLLSDPEKSVARGRKEGERQTSESRWHPTAWRVYELIQKVGNWALLEGDFVWPWALLAQSAHVLRLWPKPALDAIQYSQEQLTGLVHFVVTSAPNASVRARALRLLTKLSASEAQKVALLLLEDSKAPYLGDNEDSRLAVALVGNRVPDAVIADLTLQLQSLDSSRLWTAAQTIVHMSSRVLDDEMAKAVSVLEAQINVVRNYTSINPRRNINTLLYLSLALSRGKHRTSAKRAFDAAMLQWMHPYLHAGFQITLSPEVEKVLLQVLSALIEFGETDRALAIMNTMVAGLLLAPKPRESDTPRLGADGPNFRVLSQLALRMHQAGDPSAPALADRLWRLAINYPGPTVTQQWKSVLELIPLLSEPPIAFLTRQFEAIRDLEVPSEDIWRTVEALARYRPEVVKRYLLNQLGKPVVRETILVNPHPLLRAAEILAGILLHNDAKRLNSSKVRSAA